MRGRRSFAVGILIILCALLILPHPGSGNSNAEIVLSARIIQNPTALFTANVTQGAAPLPVQFTDQSTGGPTSWFWNFGDGANSTNQNPAHTYASGIYTVTLTVSNALGNSTKVSGNYITAFVPQLPPVALFTANVTQGVAPLPVQFTDQSTGTPTSWFWDFGDGTNSTNQNPVHTYASGIYTVNLTVSSAAGNSTKVSGNYITAFASQNPPVALFTANVTQGAAPLPVQFTDQSTGTPTSWFWDFGDGANSTDQNPAHTYASGIYTVNLTVSNAAGNSTKVSGNYITAFASQNPPVALFTANVTQGAAPLPVQFTDQSTGGPTSWFWDFGDGANSTDQNPAHTYASGIYTVTLTVSNAAGNSTKVSGNYITAFVSQPPPVVLFTANVTQGAAPLPVQFTDQSTGAPTSWFWDFGDGTNSTDQNPAHTYASGIYTVNLTVTNAGGTSTASSEKYITAYASKKTLTYTPPAGLTGTTAVSLNISQFTTSGGTPSLSGNALTLTYPAGSPFSQMTINLDSANTSNGDISGTVSSVALQTTSVSGTQLNIQLNSLPSAGTAITSTIIQGTDTSSNDKFQTFAASNGLSVVNTNYELVVSDNIPSSSIANAEITMEVPASWYSTYGSNTVRVMRLDSTGSVSMLDTTFSGFDGSNGNAIYTARSPYGLSIFAIISLQGSAPPPPSPPSSGSGSGTDTGIGVPAAGKGPQPQVQPVQPVQQPVQAPPVGQEKNLLAPAEGSLVSQTIDLSPFSQYMYTDSSGSLGATIDRNKAEQSGAVISVSGKTVEIIRPAFTLSITAGTVTEANGVVQTENIQSILLATTPIEAYAGGAGRVAASFTAGLASLPPDAALTMTVAEPVNPVVVEAFQRAVVNDGDEVQAIAYTLTVKKTNISATLPATITMSIPAAWVTAHGGSTSVVIGRIADDQTSSVLKTSFSGYDPDGNMKFVADSPAGLSVFGLIAARGPLQARAGQPAFMTLILENPVLSTVLGAVKYTIATIGIAGIAILIILIVALVTGCILWRDRRMQTRKPAQKGKK
ncbi:MAG: PKD domain-containing protein [Methanoregula sp.]|jgi:PKD repeat protein